MFRKLTRVVRPLLDLSERRALAAAKTGVYGGPLRLLAAEIFERLNRGQIVPAGVDPDADAEPGGQPARWWTLQEPSGSRRYSMRWLAASASDCQNVSRSGRTR